MKIGIIGAGSIATFIMEETQQKQKDELTVKSLFVRNLKKYEQLAADYGVELFDDIDQFLDSGIDIVVEAANVAAAQQFVPKVLEKKKSSSLVSEHSLMKHFWKKCDKWVSNTIIQFIYHLVQLAE